MIKYWANTLTSNPKTSATVLSKVLSSLRYPLGNFQPYYFVEPRLFRAFT